MTAGRGLAEGRLRGPRAQAVADLIADCMDTILGRFKPGAKITVYVRYPEYPDGSRDMVMTSDDPHEAAAALAKARTTP